MICKNITITKRKEIFAFVCIVFFVGEAILFMVNYSAIKLPSI